ncbi:hypothetical protein [Microbulbifer sp. TYP-18]|uniref:hypothetical protein n=1 Tax=Microbulbifer sp. TYP-18 TaxID=3230024 RepID=UPI0034C664E4
MNRLLYPLIFITVIFTSQSQADSTPSEFIHFQIGFETTLSDEKIIKLVQSAKAKPRALFMWSSGISATYRSNYHMEPTEFIDKARKETSSFYRNALKSNKIRLKNFAAKNSKKEFLESESLQKQVRSLLNIRSSLEHFTSTIDRGLPLIFAIEVKTPKDKREILEKNQLVKTYNSITHIENNNSMEISIPYAYKEKLNLKPEKLRKEYQDPLVTGATAGELYDLMIDLIN